MLMLVKEKNRRNVFF